MSRPARTLRSPFVAAGLAAAAAIAGLGPAPAAAQSYDIDGKLILCLPAGFPSGCEDALKHMVDRLRHGKSPIGFCAMSDGTDYDSYDIDYKVVPATSNRGWECPPVKTLFHAFQMSHDGNEVRAFCYDTAYGYQFGGQQRYTNMTRPTRTDFEVNLTVEPGTPAAFSQGWQRFDTGILRDPFTRIVHRP